MQCICKPCLETGCSDPDVKEFSFMQMMPHEVKPSGLYSYECSMDYTDHFQSSSGHRLAYISFILTGNFSAIWPLGQASRRLHCISIQSLEAICLYTKNMIIKISVSKTNLCIFSFSNMTFVNSKK
jgi:hypothetical protein